MPQVVDLADRGPGVDAAEEADLGLVDVAGSGDGALVEQGAAPMARSGSARRRRASAGLVGGAEDVGAEAADDLVLAGGGEQSRIASRNPTATHGSVRIRPGPRCQPRQRSPGR